MHKEQHQQRPKLSCLLLRFVVDIRPTEEVSEYTASIAYKLLVEGKDGQQAVDSLKFALRAEGMSILFLKKTCFSHMLFLMSIIKSHIFWLCGFRHSTFWGYSHHEIQQEQGPFHHPGWDTWLRCGGRHQGWYDRQHCRRTIHYHRDLQQERATALSDWACQVSQISHKLSNSFH